MSKGEVFRKMRNPQVARNAENGGAVITLSGEEDEFVVLQLDRDAGDELARRLHVAGFTGETKG